MENLYKPLNRWDFHSYEEFDDARDRLVWERRHKAYTLKENVETLKQIGQEMNISAERARQLIRKHELWIRKQYIKALPALILLGNPKVVDKYTKN